MAGGSGTGLFPPLDHRLVSSDETWQPLHDRITTLDEVTRGLFLATKAMDLTRPVLDTSGYSHRVPEADVYDSHDYTQDPDTFAAHHARVADGAPFYNGRDGQTWSIPYQDSLSLSVSSAVSGGTRMQRKGRIRGVTVSGQSRSKSSTNALHDYAKFFWMIPPISAIATRN